MRTPGMVDLNDFPAAARSRILNQDLPSFGETAWVDGPALSQRRVAIVSTAGLHVRSDRPFGISSSEYRIIPGDVSTGDLVMSHVSTNFDRTGFQQDVNTVFPIDRLRELAADGKIGSTAAYHYSFMGATPPEQLEETARDLAGLLKQDRVDAALLVPV